MKILEDKDYYKNSLATYKNINAENNYYNSFSYKNLSLIYYPCLRSSFFLNSRNIFSESLCFTKRLVRTPDNLAKFREVCKLRVEKRLLNKMLNRFELSSMRASVKRSLNRINSLFDCNSFSWFVTLTTDKDIINRADDKLVKRALRYWLKSICRLFPNFYYIIVPEYHKKGCLHFHCLFGGISAEELNIYDSGKKSKGREVFSTSLWKFGLSDVQEIRSLEGSKGYLAKYMVKFKYDVRFFNQRRFYYGGNIKKPEQTVSFLPLEKLPFVPNLNLLSLSYNTSFCNREGSFAVFNHSSIYSLISYQLSEYAEYSS